MKHAALLLLAACCMGVAGCAAIIAAIPAQATAAAVSAKAALVAAAPVIAPAGAAAGAAGASGALGPDANPDRLMGMSRANLETCAGFTGRTSEVLPDATERWSWQHTSCRVSVTLTGGYVSKIEYSDGSAACGSLLQYCR